MTKSLVSIGHLWLATLILSGELLGVTSSEVQGAKSAWAPEEVHRHIDHMDGPFSDELCELVSIPSISALPEHASDVRRAAQWLQKRIQQAGFDKVEVHETSKYPVIYAEYEKPHQTPTHQDAPTVLIYGHYDVQPADPLELWEGTPFPSPGDCKPSTGTRKEFNEAGLRGRGAADDKGSGILPALQGIQAVMESEAGAPVKVKLLFEGMEEIGSPGLKDWMADNMDKIKADVYISADGSQVSASQPGLLTGLRGMAAMEFTVTTADTDVHSGAYGGAIQNPLHAVARLVDSLHAEDGRVLVEGWYDEVRKSTSDDAMDIQGFNQVSDQSELLRGIGVNETVTPGGVSAYEAIWNMPTVEVVGMWGGFTDAGIKTVIPKQGHAKLAFRLVPYQDPATLMSLMQRHLEKHLPRGCQLSINIINPGNKAFLTHKNGAANQIAARLLERYMDKEPVWYKLGGSIPAITFFHELMGDDVDVAFLAFALPDNKVHAPNEFMYKHMYKITQHAYADLLFQVGAMFQDGPVDRSEL